MEQNYTREYIDELKSWFDSQELPADLQINEASYSPDLKETIECTYLQIIHNFGNPTFDCNVRQLEEIRKRLEE